MKESRGHSEVCRGRIWEAMDLDEEGRRHKEAQEERVTRRRAGNLESEVEQRDHGVVDCGTPAGSETKGPVRRA